MLEAAAAHQGTSLIEIFQNCPVFNDGAFDAFVGRKVQETEQLQVEDGEPLLFGAQKEKGVALEGLTPKVIEQDGNGALDKVVRYDKRNKWLASFVSQLPYPQFPVPVGVLYEEDRPVYEEELHKQIAFATEKKGKGDLKKLLHGEDCWTVTK